MEKPSIDSWGSDFRNLEGRKTFREFSNLKIANLITLAWMLTNP